MALLMLLIALSALWLWGDGSLFTKDAGESHAIYLSAFNIHSLQTFFVQDLAASPDPSAHPFFYIHSPNLPNRLLSYLLIRIGTPLGQQVYITILIGIVALACGYAALQRMFSAWFALGALGFLGLTYNSYYYNVGDLLRGLLYVWFWLALAVLAADPSLKRRRTGLAIAALSGIVMLSDWGYALFFYMFLLLWSSYASARLPVRWYLAHVVAPAVVALVIYEFAVISAVGWDFYLHDLAVTYLGRMGIGGRANYLSAFGAYQLHRVILWLGTAERITFADLLAALAVAPALTSGPLWAGLLGVLCAAPVQTLRGVSLNRWAWAALGVAALLLFLGFIPLQVVVPACAAAALLLAKVRQLDPSPAPVARMMAFITALWLAVLAEGAAFPYSTLTLVIGPARPPMPFLGMAAAGLVVHALAISRHHLHSWGELQGRARAWFNASRLPSIAFAVMLIGYVCAPFIALSAPDAASYGFPPAVIFGIASFDVAVAAAALFWIAWPAVLGRQTSRSARLLARVGLPAMVVVILVLMSHYQSATPAVLGRYSTRYALTLLATGAFGAIATAVLWWPRIAVEASHRARRIASRFAPMASGISLAALSAAALQVAWFAISLAGHPPESVPYASLLSHPPYRGASFLASTDGQIPWLYTRGWVYLTDSNPPVPGRPNIRYRFVADWQNEEKYGHPDYYLCDNTIFSSMRPGHYDKEWFAAHPPDMPACAATGTCTCRDVAKRMAAEGNTVEVDRDDYSIIRFNWKKTSSGQPAGGSQSSPVSSPAR